MSRAAASSLLWESLLGASQKNRFSFQFKLTVVLTELQSNLPLVSLMSFQLLLTCSIGINVITVSFQMKRIPSLPVQRTSLYQSHQH